MQVLRKIFKGEFSAGQNAITGIIAVQAKN